ncbi:redoxin domain-containing protein [Halobaculum magnesiiphilum]|uniref:Redoxin domain-containing protein n=1 Tax=Halobaculum magnesiiphilum TaxID=1017351 RepID=A0A8T8W9U7_9EURY|nr:redoxin domain-containing protein [Halobaculum magnesiiphilum]QZP36632.1 redoxin domain-containing protein [Halobaculum magnesiiphilum]
MVDFDVVELPEADHVAVGEEAPDFTRPLVGDEYWTDTALSALDGPVALVFFPMDGAFPATYVWNEIRDRGWGHGDTDDVTVAGVSISTPYEHKTFIDERGMDYELFSDPSAEVGERYGAVQDLDGMAGIREHRPAVFLLDEDHVVEYAWVAAEWPDFPDYDEVETHLERL